MIHVSVPIRTGNGQNDREHWRKRARRVKAEKEAVGYLFAGKRAPPGPVSVLMVRVSPRSATGWRGLDEHDNLRASLKAPVDAVAIWLGRDDADKSIQWQYGQREGPWAVEIHVIPL